MTEWINENSRSWRWTKKFAYLPVKTIDTGWIFWTEYWLWQSISGWGFNDNWAYTECKCLGCRDNLPWISGCHPILPDGMMKCNS